GSGADFAPALVVAFGAVTVLAKTGATFGTAVAADREAGDVAVFAGDGAAFAGGFAAAEVDGAEAGDVAEFGAEGLAFDEPGAADRGRVGVDEGEDLVALAVAFVAVVEDSGAVFGVGGVNGLEAQHRVAGADVGDAGAAAAGARGCGLAFDLDVGVAAFG